MKNEFTKFGHFSAVTPDDPHGSFHVYDDDQFLFSVPAAIADTEARREAIANAWIAGHNAGHRDGQKAAQASFREALGIEAPN